MKRVLSLLLALAVFLAAPLTAYAAEDDFVESYAFYPNEFSTFGNLTDFRPSDSTFWSNGSLPDGEYIIRFFVNSVLYASDPVTLTFDSQGSEDSYHCSVSTIFPDVPDVVFRFSIYRSSINTYFYVYANEEFVDLSGYTDVIYFDRVTEDSDAKSMELLEDIEGHTEQSVDYLRVISGCVVFFTIAAVCFFVYKFFRIFF